MRVTSDDQNLITAGKDGTLIVFDIKDKEGFILQRYCIY